ncbi:unnamed protein product [Aphanomyces euteiches]
MVQDDSWTAAVWKALENKGWEETELCPGSYFYSSPEVDSIDAFEKNTTAFGTKKEAIIHALQNDVYFDVVQPLLWEHMRYVLGWQVFMRQGKDPWYVKPETPWHQLKPQVTLFESPVDAVESFLASIMTYKRKQSRQPSAKSNKRQKSNTQVVPTVASKTKSSSECAQVLKPPVSECQNQIDDGMPTTSSKPSKECRTPVRHSIATQDLPTCVNTEATTPRRVTRSSSRPSSPERSENDASASNLATPKRPTTACATRTPRKLMDEKTKSDVVATPKRSTLKKISVDSTLSSDGSPISTPKRASPRIKSLESTKSASPATKKPSPNIGSSSNLQTEKKSSPSRSKTKTGTPKTPTKAKVSNNQPDTTITTKSAEYLKNLSNKLDGYNSTSKLIHDQTSKSSTHSTTNSSGKSKGTPEISREPISTPRKAVMTPSKKSSKGIRSTTPRSIGAKRAVSADIIELSDTTPPTTPKKLLKSARVVNDVEATVPVTPKKAKRVSVSSSEVRTPRTPRTPRRVSSNEPFTPATIPRSSTQSTEEISLLTPSPLSGKSKVSEMVAKKPFVQATSESSETFPTLDCSSPRSPIIPGSALLPPNSKHIGAFVRTPSPNRSNSSPKLKNQLQLDSINNILAQSSVSPVNPSSLRGLLDSDSPAVNSGENVETTAKDSSSWTYVSPEKHRIKRLLNPENSDRSPKKQRNSAVASSIATTSPSAETDDDLATFLKETVREEQSPCPSTSSSLSSHSPGALYNATDMGKLLDSAIGSLIKSSPCSSPSSFVTPDAVDKSYRKSGQMQPGKESTYRRKEIIQAFSQCGWKTVAPKLNGMGSYMYTHDKLKDQTKFTREELVNYAKHFDIFNDPSLLDPVTVAKALKGERKILKTVKPRPSADWSA